ncbi:MAG: bifunctional DNA-formamidopyrimidine glycosylase/DNA-(apurinic or apyrimidinic site) lyase [Alphaproteobacteria bacterium]|nr:bifunctional DNA-formamidopyrimidine glycosylase/DNA-(apurinic or apyrimidinic site) lyase [Alphaproteobacteria bacterium]
MPELPEVETTRRGLAAALLGRRLVRVEVRQPRLRFPVPIGFVQHLTGRRIEAIDRRAKYMLVRLDSADTMILHLGMSGRLRVYALGNAPPPPERHDHIILATDDGAEVRFNDARRFGFVDLVAGRDLAAHPMLASLGPEPLDTAFTPAVLSAALAGKRTPVKAALLDQKTVAGLGNIYVSEALFRAGISPRRSAHTVAGARAGRLVPAIRHVLEEAIAVGGSSLRDFRRADGELGCFQTRFAVYDRAGGRCGDPLADCDGTTCCVRRLVQAGRSTFYCPRRQR